jgi:hypothetical protein
LRLLLRQLREEPKENVMLGRGSLHRFMTLSFPTAFGLFWQNSITLTSAAWPTRISAFSKYALVRFRSPA